MPKDALKSFIKTLLNTEEDVQVFHGCNRSPHNNDNTSLGMDHNLTNRLSKYTNTVQEKENQKIPLMFLCNIGLVNLPLKLDTKLFGIFFPLKKDMNKLFKYTKKIKTIPDAPNAQILWDDIPYFRYQQIRLDNKFRMYYETVLLSKKVFQVDVQKISYQKLIELGIGM